jgi:adenylate cyclase
VVEETLAGRGQSLKQYTIAVKALGRSSGFDPQTDTIVRVQAGRLRRALQRYYDTLGVDNPVIIELPKGSYIPRFQYGPPNNPTPPKAIAEATASQSVSDTPPGRPSEPATSASVTPDTPPALPDGPSIAVLSFTYLGNNQEKSYLATGLTEEILIALTRFQDFLVVGPLTKGTIPEKEREVRRIGQSYGVRFVLDGTVRINGQTLRLTVRLADAANGQQLWGEALDCSLQDTTIVDCEHSVVDQVVATIADNFGIIPRTLTKEVLAQHDDSLTDYEAVLRFHHHNRTLTEESLTNAIAALEEIVQRDPSHDLAMALLADLVGAPYFLGFVDDMSGLERAETLTRKALALNPKSQQAHFAMAQIHYQRFHQAACLAETEQVLALNPNNANYLAISALFLMGLGQGERSLALIQKAMRLNPHHPGWYHFVPFLNYYRQGEYEAALFEAKRFNTPEYFWDPLIRAAVLGQLDRRTEAKKVGGELLVLVPDFESRGRSLIKRMVYLDEHVEILVDGLHKAGLEMKR